MNAQQMIRLQRAIEHVARVMNITRNEHTESDLILMVDVFGPRLNVNEIEEDWTKALVHNSFDDLISDHHEVEYEA